MRTLIGLAAGILLGACEVCVASAQSPAGMPSYAHTVVDSATGHRFALQVGVPTGYARDSLRRYGVLFVLDGDKSFGLARDIVDWLSFRGAREVPPLIVVGIGYGTSESDWWQQRSRDLTFTPDRSRMWGDWPLAGGARAFTTWFKQTLVPFIDRAYRTIPGDRTIAGVSLGGLYAAWAAIDDPTLFPRAIAVNAAFAWDSLRIRDVIRGRIAHGDPPPLRLYLALSDRDAANVQEPWHTVTAALDSLRRGQLRLVAEILPGETHLSGWPVGLTHGLKAVYRP